RLRADGIRVLSSSRTPRSDDPDAVVLDDAALAVLPELDTVVWAHGINVNDAVDTMAVDDLERMLDVNVVLVARQLQGLLAAGRLRDGGSVVVLSSIWEQIARPGKFSYAVSKAAVGGLVRAAAADLAPRGIRVNAVLPGVVDTAMTRAMLSPGQVAAVEGATGSGRMVLPEDVANVVSSLTGPAAAGMTGQSVVVDLGFTVVRPL
ncbi:MAG: SDR family oxidoreductase, partial [Actinobacteria bacterium]|nr:SDR family oxidoreductase [Actinomycetota bacterium]